MAILYRKHSRTTNKTDQASNTVPSRKDFYRSSTIAIFNCHSIIDLCGNSANSAIISAIRNIKVRIYDS